MTREVEVDDRDLHAGHVAGGQLCPQLRIAVARGGADRVRADRAGAEAGHPQRPAARMGEVRVHPRDLHEREAHTVPSHGLQVFHLAPAEVIDDGIERDGAQTEIGDQLGAAWTGRVVQHRDQHRVRAHRAQRGLVGATDHRDDVARQHLGVIGEPHLRRGGEVGVLTEAHAGAVPVLQHDLARARSIGGGDELR